MKQLLDRLASLEARAPTSEAGRLFLVYLDDGRYLIDGVEVGPGEWHERRLMAGLSSYVVEVEYVDLCPEESR